MGAWMSVDECGYMGLLIGREKMGYEPQWIRE